MTKYPNTIDDLPKGEFYAILKNDGVHIPGDERSRQAPGHGYPAHTRNYLSFQVFNKEEITAEIENRLKHYPNEKLGKDYIVVKVEPQSVSIKVQVEMK
jgi:hypothetical protein